MKLAQHPLDDYWMALAIGAAQRGEPAPNPHVGAVVVFGTRLVGLGWHERAGAAHAEVVALEQAGERARGATLYVTLEPCNHFGRTPPCVDAIVRAGIARVVIGCPDPNPHVAGQGGERLQKVGVHLRTGVLRGAARRLIADWSAIVVRVGAAADPLTAVATKRPL